MSSEFLSVGTFSAFTAIMASDFHTLGSVFAEIAPVDRSMSSFAMSLEDSLSGKVSANAGYAIVVFSSADGEV